MQYQVVYRCPGTCGGVSPAAKNCGAGDCTHYNKPLQAAEQCEPCAAAAGKDSGVHGCPMCKLV